MCPDAADVPGVDQVWGYGAEPGEGSQDGEPGTPETLRLCHFQGCFLSPLPPLSLFLSLVSLCVCVCVCVWWNLPFISCLKWGIM